MHSPRRNKKLLHEQKEHTIENARIISCSGGGSSAVEK
jgi:hypothetical protein